MQLHVEATGVTHRLSLRVASPQCGGAGVAVSAAKAGPARRGLQSFLGFDERPVDAVHLVVEAAGVAQIVSGSVPAPQRRGHRAAVDALPALSGHVVHQV